MARAAGGILTDKPSGGEAEMFRDAGTRFQMVMLVASIAQLRTGDGAPVAYPRGQIRKPMRVIPTGVGTDSSGLDEPLPRRNVRVGGTPLAFAGLRLRRT